VQDDATRLMSVTCDDHPSQYYVFSHLNSLASLLIMSTPILLTRQVGMSRWCGFCRLCRLQRLPIHRALGPSSVHVTASAASRAQVHREPHEVPLGYILCAPRHHSYCRSGHLL
jgi:hypothetical protein